MAKKEDIKRAFQAVKNGLKKKYGADVIVDTSEFKDMPSISTGSPSLDNSIGIGGLPKGRIVEIFGPESCGKTSLVSIVCGNAQKEDPDRFIGFVDVEHALNPQYASSLGMEQGDDKVCVTQPMSGEEALDTTLSFVESGAFSVVVVDSVGGIQTKRQLEGEIGKDTMGEVARIMSQTVPKIVKAANKTQTLVLFINQERSSMAMYGPATVTMGGKSLPYFASVRIRMRKTDVILDDKKKPCGQKLEIKVIKNKVGTPFGVVENELYFFKGFDKQAELVDEAIKSGIIAQGGAWYYVNKDTDDEIRFQGKANVVKHYRENPDDYSKLLEELLNSDKKVLTLGEAEEEISAEELDAEVLEGEE